MKNNNRLAVGGLVMLLPASILVSSGLVGFNVIPLVIHPVLVMGGLLSALVVNLVAVLGVQMEREEGHLAALAVRILAKPFNLTVIGISAFLLATLLAYAFVENFRPR